MMYYADATDATLQVSIELADLRSALLNLPVVRSDLSDERVPAEARIKLLFALIGEDANLNKVTMRLAEHATCNPRNRRYLSTLHWLINKFSRHMGESMVTVTTAAPLNQGQIDRLIAIYTKKVGRPVHINSTVDPHRDWRHAHRDRRRGDGQHRGGAAGAAAAQGESRNETLKTYQSTMNQ